MSDASDFVLIGAGNSPVYWWDHTGWFWTMGLHGLFWLALIGLVVFSAVVLIRSPKRTGVEPEFPAKALLDARYARGEIDRGEYLERKRDLS